MRPVIKIKMLKPNKVFRYWQYRHSGGELLMMTARGEPSAYYPMDSNGLAVQNAPAQPCVCAVVMPAQTAACPPLGYGGCEGGECGETNSPVFLIAFRSCMPQPIIPPWVTDLISCFARCKELDDRCRRNAELERDRGFMECSAEKNACYARCFEHPVPDQCRCSCDANYDLCKSRVLGQYQNALNRCDSEYDRCREAYTRAFPKPENPSPNRRSRYGSNQMVR